MRSLLLLLFAGVAFAQAPDRSYEQALISDSLEFQMLKPDPKPEGKIIERIVIVNYDVVTEHDPWPRFVNSIHSTTKRDVVARELLFRVGDRWDPELIYETTRNLRDFLMINVGEITAVRGSTPDKIIALVTVKDIWSLRLNWGFSYVGSRLEELSAELAETNLFGRNKKLGVTLDYDLATTSLGQNFEDPRLWGTRVALEESIKVIGNRSQGVFEGADIDFSVGQPLYQTSSEWGWKVSARHLRDVYRLFSAGELDELRVDTGESVPYAFHRNILNLSASGTRSFGRLHKHDYTFGWRAFTRNFELPNPLIKPLQAASVEDFNRKQLPFDQRAGMLFASYHFYRREFRRVYNLDTFALPEDIGVGPNLTVGSDFATPAFGFDSTFAEPSLSAGYNWVMPDSILLVSAMGSIRYQPQTTFESAWVDQDLSFGVKYYSPRFSKLRLVTGARAVRRIHDLDRELTILGGNNLLRGYPSNYFGGPNSWSSNLELRTPPWIFQTIHTGASVFVDTGDAFRDGEGIGLHASTGLGLRILFPQFNRAVFRVDLGFPLESAPDIDPMSISAEFGQAF